MRSHIYLVFILKAIWRSKLMNVLPMVLLTLLCTVSQVWANVSYAQKAKVSINERNTALRTVLEKIEDQTEFFFMYDASVVDVNRKVDVVVQDIAVDEALDQVLKGTNINYRIENRQIVLNRSETKMVSTNAQQQSLRISGTVRDERGETILGATVVEKGTTNGTTTDLDGNFSINVRSTANILVVSFIGMRSQEISISGQTTINVILKEEVSQLDEVVVVGYGTMRRADLTGAVASVSGEMLQRVPVASVAEAMKGKLAGVQITTVDGSPDAEIIIRVRGGGSVTQDNSPLYIVDGFPVSNINDIAPNDIASIDVLKDASSSAIYGARGANGVIIITTKSAKAGKTSVSYNAFGQFRQLPSKLDVLSPYEFVLAQYEYAKMRDPNATADLASFQKYFGVFDDLELYKAQRGTDWQEQMFGKSTFSQSHNLSVSGGTEKTKMTLSLSHNNDEGLLIGSGYKRTNVNYKMNHDISDALRIDLNFRYSNTVVDGAGTSGGSDIRMKDVITNRPVNGLADQIEVNPNDDSDDYEEFIRSRTNPVEWVQQDWRRRTEDRYNMQAAVNWSIMKNLQYRSEFGVDYLYRDNKRYYGPLTSTSRNEGGNLPLGQIETRNDNTMRWSNVLTWDLKPADGHKLNVMGGQEVMIRAANTQLVRAKYFSETIEPEKLFANMALGTYDRMSTTVNPEDRMLSFFGRAHYSIMDKYLMQFTLRSDGSSKFAPGNQWGLFPAGSVAWRISEEDFMGSIDLISNLKIRASYGEAGNNRIADDMWRRTFRISDNRPYGFNNVPNPYYVAASSTLVNPDLRWETTVTRNMGLDFGLLENRISGTFDIYRNTTKDLLVEGDIPPYLGYSKQLRNIGETQNQGFEVILESTIFQKRDFSLSVSFNIGFNNMIIKHLDGVDEKPFNSSWAGTDLQTIDDYRVFVGQSVGLMWGYVTDGFYTVNDFESYDEVTRTYKLKEGVTNGHGVLKSPFSLRPGLLKLKSLDDDNLVTAEKDRTIIGNASPKHTGGLNLMASFKNFDLSTYFTWVYGNDIYNTGKISYNMLYRTSYGNMLTDVSLDNRFTYIDFNGVYGEAGALITDLAQLGELNKDATIWSPFSTGTAAPVFHSWAVEDGSFLRLSNVTLGYTLPRNISSKILINSLRVYATVYNAWIWTNYSGFDPEVSTTRSSSYSALTPGVDYSSYPKSRSYTFGINVTF